MKPVAVGAHARAPAAIRVKRFHGSMLMTTLKQRVLLFAVSFFLLNTAANAASLDLKLSYFRDAEKSYFTEGSTQTLQEFGRRLEAAYRTSLKPEIAPARLKRLNDKDLGALFDITDKVAFYSESGDVAKDMEGPFLEISNRRLAMKQRVTDFHYVCLLTRRFDAASTLVKKYPEAHLLHPPLIRKSVHFAKTERVFSIADGVRSVSIEKLSWKKGPRIIMLSSPTCNPSNQAISDIESDPSLKLLFEAHALLIHSSHDIAELPEIVAWKQKHPSLRNYIAYSSADWPQFKKWGTPTFYFIKDGKILSSFGGWKDPVSESKAALVRGMELIGLHLASAPARKAD